MSPNKQACASLVFILNLVHGAPTGAQMLDSRLWETDGSVRAIAKYGNTLYIAGSFNYVRPHTGSWAALNPSTGLPISYPDVDGPVYTQASDGMGGWYIGGEFRSVAGQSRNRLAHVLADGTLSGWNPDADGIVRVIAVSGSTVYAGGQFSSIGGQTRGNIAALDAATGSTTPWSPNANGSVNVIEVSSSIVFVGGDFTSIGGQSRSKIAALDAATGGATSWNPGANGIVRSIVVAGSTVYVGGGFTGIAAEARSQIAALDLVTGTATLWNPDADGPVTTIAVSGSTVYVAGQFSSVGGQSRSKIAALDAATGGATSWNPGTNDSVFALAISGSTVYAGGRFTTIGGQPRKYIAALDAVSGTPTPWIPLAHGFVRTLMATESVVFIGGDFPSIGGRARKNLAALDLTTGTATPWNPAVDDVVEALAVWGSKLFVGGRFTTVNNQPGKYIAEFNADTGDVRWAGTGWMNGHVSTLALGEAGVYVGGNFRRLPNEPPYPYYITFYNAEQGGFWHEFGPGYMDGSVSSIQVSKPDRSRAVLFVRGSFRNIGMNGFVTLLGSNGGLSGWSPQNNGPMFAFAALDSTYFVGGEFSSIGTQPRSNIAALHATTAAATSWNPGVNGRVRVLKLSGSALYVGGDFSSVGGQPRTNIAALHADTGAPTPWNPGANGYVDVIEVIGSTVYLAGSFSNIAGRARHGLAAVIDGVTPVEISDLEAYQDGVDVVLRWRGAREVQVVAYSVFRSYSGGSFERLGPDVELNAEHTYTFRDAAPTPGHYTYRIAEVGPGGSVVLHGGVDVAVERVWPVTRLYPGAPNPFNPSITLHYDLGQDGVVSLEILDVKGRRVRSLLPSGKVPAGRRQVVWDGSDDDGRRAASGVYYARLHTQGRVWSQPLTLLK